MNKTILITGSTDGIGITAAEMLVEMGHRVLLHGRSAEKVGRAKKKMLGIDPSAQVDGFAADLSSLDQVRRLAEEVSGKYRKIDVLINNAGVFVAREAVTEDGLDLRFAVNAIAPYLLTRLLLPIMDGSGRIVNLSSAAQSAVDINALMKAGGMSDNDAYAQSKLALTMWSFHMAKELKRAGGPSVVAVNPKSFLGSKMVKQAYGTEGYDIRIGGDILCRASLSDEFADANGKYYDNDIRRFADPHPDAMDDGKCREVVETIEKIVV